MTAGPAIAGAAQAGQGATGLGGSRHEGTLPAWPAPQPLPQPAFTADDEVTACS
jgi:hypothetical protein